MSSCNDVRPKREELFQGTLVVQENQVQTASKGCEIRLIALQGNWYSTGWTPSMLWGVEVVMLEN
jgi:hypothetical protein